MSRFFKDGRNHFYYGLLGVAILGACLSVALGCGTHSGNPTLTETGFTPAGVEASPSPTPTPTSTPSAMLLIKDQT
jgi:hypothetical protein